MDLSCSKTVQICFRFELSLTVLKLLCYKYSNLNTIGKILERLALSCFFPHISKSPSFSPLQSANRKFHSTETALLKLTNDTILESIDSGKITILTTLDMSAAFDTQDHITLLHRLQQTFGLSGHAISWIRSYLTDRSFFVKIDSSSSPSTSILTGVPQGSVLGPLLLVFFMSPVANVINSDQSNQSNSVFFHQYADDTQLYIGTNSSTLTSQIASIESCTQRDHNWLLNNGLHLNPSKSEAIAFYNPKSTKFTLTHKCPFISRCLKHARFVISIFVPCVTFVLLLLLRLLKL